MPKTMSLKTDITEASSGDTHTNTHTPGAVCDDVLYIFEWELLSDKRTNPPSQ